MNFIQSYIHNSWKEFLDREDIKEELSFITKKLEGVNITPKEERVFRFMTMDCTNIKVVIMGQDPYPQEGVAVGRAFEVGGLDSWNSKKINTSLQNILKLLYVSYKEIPYYSLRPSLDKIREEISNGTFNILPPDELFNYWQSQGVLMLNKALTCEVGDPNSHASIWDNFTNELIKFVSAKNPNAYWILWGNNAKTCKNIIKDGIFIESRHPSRVSSSYNDDFLKCECFTKTSNLIDWYGKSM